MPHFSKFKNDNLINDLMELKARIKAAFNDFFFKIIDYTDPSNLKDLKLDVDLILKNTVRQIDNSFLDSSNHESYSLSRSFWLEKDSDSFVCEYKSSVSNNHEHIKSYIHKTRLLLLNSCLFWLFMDTYKGKMIFNTRISFNNMFKCLNDFVKESAREHPSFASASGYTQDGNDTSREVEALRDSFEKVYSKEESSNSFKEKREAAGNPADAACLDFRNDLLNSWKNIISQKQSKLTPKGDDRKQIRKKGINSIIKNYEARMVWQYLLQEKIIHKTRAEKKMKGKKLVNYEVINQKAYSSEDFLILLKQIKEKLNANRPY